MALGSNSTLGKPTLAIGWVDSPAPKKLYAACEIHTSEQVLKAWIGTQIVEQWVNLKRNHPIRALLVGGFEPTEGFFFLAQGSVDPGYPIGC